MFKNSLMLLVILISLIVSPVTSFSANVDPICDKTYTLTIDNNIWDMTFTCGEFGPGYIGTVDLKITPKDSSELPNVYTYNFSQMNYTDNLTGTVFNDNIIDVNDLGKFYLTQKDLTFIIMTDYVFSE